MGKAWQRIDLEGGGLQAANVRLAARLKRRDAAWWRLAAFPLGLHRSYLEDPRGAWGYRLATLIAVMGWATGYPLACALAVAAIALRAAFDIRWIDDRVAAINKRLRVEVYLADRPGAPSGFKGHHTDDILDDYLREKAAERPGHGPAPDSACRPGQRAPSLAEQERLLREIARRRKPSG